MDKLKAKLQANPVLTVVVVAASSYVVGTLVGHSLAKSLLAATAVKK